MAREVTITEPEVVDDQPKGPASICIEGPPQRQCYTAAMGYGRFPVAELVELERGMPALLFSAATGGVSGFDIRFALLRPGTGNFLEDLFRSDTSVTNQSRHAFWSDPAISTAQIFVTASFVWGPDEAHYDPHRYLVSAYVMKPSSYYYLEDRYMTLRKYDLEAKADILASEKQEILARLRRVKPATQPRPRTPR